MNQDNPNTRPQEYFTEDDFAEIYKKIMSDGYFSKGAGDMWEPNTRPEDLAKIANAKLNALLSTGVRVWGLEEKKVWYVGESDANDTHTALLINIQPIEKPECREHELGATHFDADTKIYRYECKHCGTELEKIVTWKEKGGEHG